MVPENSDGRVSAEVDTSKVVTGGAAIVPVWREDDPVEVRFPLPDDECDRSSWPWLPGTILTVCGLDEWQVCVEVRELATLEDGRTPRRRTPEHQLFYPVCFRDASEIRGRSLSGERGEADR